MKRATKIISILLSFLLMFALVCCSSDSSETNGKSSGESSKPIKLTTANWKEYIGVDVSWDVRDGSVYNDLFDYMVPHYYYTLTDKFFLKKGGHLNDVTINVKQHFIGGYSEDLGYWGWYNDQLSTTNKDPDIQNQGVISFSLTLPSNGESSYTIRDLEHLNGFSSVGMYRGSDKEGDLNEDQYIEIVSITGEFVPDD